MQRASRALAVALGFSAVVLAQEPKIEQAAIWTDTVKHGDMAVMVRGRGVLRADNTATLSIPADLMQQVQPGQRASIDTGHGVVEGKVARVGQADVVVSFEGPFPESVRPGAAVDGTIHIGTLNGVAYVGRPVACHLNADDTIFKLAPDGHSATRVKVHYGKGSVNLVEVRSGLEAGDRVILSDMSAYQGQDRVRVE